MAASSPASPVKGKVNTRSGLWILALVLTVSALFALFLGRYPKPGFISPSGLASDALALRVLLYLRLPRLLASLLLGAALGAGGCVFQMLFRNPLVEPGFLGVSPGAAFGAALAILLIPGNFWAVQLSAVAFAFAGLGLSYLIASKLPFGGWIIRLVISGISVSAFFTSGLGVLKYMADPLSQLQELTFWMLGGLHGTTWNRLLSVLPLVIPGLTILVIMRWRLNVLSLDDKSAYSLGARPGRERFFLLLAASAAVAGVTAVAGIIAWIGLIVPHIARRFFGVDGRTALPASMLAGAFGVLLCDTVARAAVSVEIPLGILTSFLGATLFIMLLSTGKVRFRR